MVVLSATVVYFIPSSHISRGIFEVYPCNPIVKALFSDGPNPDFSLKRIRNFRVAFGGRFYHATKT